MEHSERILKILAERGITGYKVAKATGLTSSLFTEWRRKPSSKIYSGNLVLIADYLGCSVDYLLGRTEDPARPLPLSRAERELILGFRTLERSEQSLLLRILGVIPDANY